MKCMSRSVSVSAFSPIASRRASRSSVRPMALANEVAQVAGLTDSIYSALAPSAEYFGTLGLPAPLVKFGHPGNMAVVLLAMGGYGSYLGWTVRKGEAEVDVLQKAADLHPKLMGGMFFFFAAGASGGIMSSIMQGRPILESTHSTTAFLGLALLAGQALLPAFFGSGNPAARTAHAYLGSSIMALFLVHAFFGVQLALTLAN